MGLTSKGWHNESMRHSEAKRFGKASGGKPTAPKGVKSISGKKTKSKANLTAYDIYKTKVTPNQAVAYHNKEAKRLLAKNDFAGYRYHTREAIKINEKLILARMQGKKEISYSEDKKEEKKEKEEFQNQRSEIKPDHKITPEDYSGYTGTENYYKEYMGINVTDGVKDLQTRAEANWLVSDIAVIVKSEPKVKTQDFVTIKVDSDGNSAKVNYEDGNGGKLYSQNYKISDFPKGKWKFFYRDNVLMLPSEY